VNSVLVSGVVVADAELRTGGHGRRYVVFDCSVDLPPGRDVYVKVKFFFLGEAPSLALGDRVIVTGALKYNPHSGLFISAYEVILAAPTKPGGSGSEIENTERLTK